MNLAVDGEGLVEQEQAVWDLFKVDASRGFCKMVFIIITIIMILLWNGEVGQLQWLKDTIINYEDDSSCC